SEPALRRLTEEKHKKRIKLLNEIFTHFLYLVTVAIIACIFIFSTETKRQYEVEIGKPWQYQEDLIADFDFPIYKLPSEVEEERKAILDHMVYYFELDSTVAETQIAQLKNYINTICTDSKLTAEWKPYANYISQALSEIYAVGILNNDSISRLLPQADHVVILRGKFSKSHSVEELYTQYSAYEHIKKNWPIGLDTTNLQNLGVINYLQGNLQYDADLTEQVLNDKINSILLTSGMVQKGELIIGKGEIVTQKHYKILDSYSREIEDQRELSTQKKILLIIGKILLSSILVLLFYLYMRMFRRKQFDSKRYTILCLLLICGFVAITALSIEIAGSIHRIGYTLVYAVPYALLPIIISTFIDTRTGLFAHLITIALCAFMVPSTFEFLLLQITAGMVTIISLKDVAQRSQLLQTAGLVFLCYCFVYLGYGLTLDGNILKMSKSMYFVFILNTGLLLLAYPLIFIVEKVFKFTSNVTLIELSNINSPLLRKLSETAPGTFQHSLQVSNLASSIANKVGGNALMARAGALYHDIGKIKNSAFYTENQAKGVNPHNKLKPEESANIIIRHVTDGVALAKQEKLPRSIIEFIETHHGRGKARFFYNTWVNTHPGETPNEALFTYPGPNPYTKEQGIVMLCDSVEAASRSLQTYTEENINDLVENIVNSMVSEHLFDNTPLTLKQITTAKDILKEKLKTIYHTRIAYPQIENNRENNDGENKKNM
ncbi:MAG: HDIG domain-containing protein, partial [Paludibacteraceae bacterium]|nr:HDIG domain-containing protein [Paludibacteraceae bacterium]